MCDDDACGGDALYASHDCGLAPSVEPAGGFVEEHDAWSADEGGCYADALNLAAGEGRRVVVDRREHAHRHGFDVRVDVRQTRSPPTVFDRQVFAHSDDVVEDVPRLKDAVLGNDADLSADRFTVEIGEFSLVVVDGSGSRILKT